jgi:putative transposase
MLLAKRIRLIPTLDQENQLLKSANIARWAYNWALVNQIKHFEKTGRLIIVSNTVLRKELTRLKQTETHSWLYEVSNNVTKQAIKDLCKAIDRFHKESKKHGYKLRLSAKKKEKHSIYDFENFPKFKSEKKSKPSFYHDTETIRFISDKVYIEKIGWVQLSEKNLIPTNYKYKNPRVSFDGKYWFLSVCIEQTNSPIQLTNEIIGIDLGIKELAVCSNEERFKNINKTKTVRKAEKRLRRLQRRVSRKYEINKEGIRFIKTKNIEKFEKRILLLNRRLNGIRNDHIHQTTNAIVKTKPRKIVMEALNVSGMLKNKYLSETIAKQKLFDFKIKMKYKSDKYGIKFVEADRWYPSSKTCSCCGNIKKDLKLSDRVYSCNICENVMDRDLNAAINLSHYKK